jgi:hypothetical protein
LEKKKQKNFIRACGCGIDLQLRGRAKPSIHCDWSIGARIDRLMPAAQGKDRVVT